MKTEALDTHGFTAFVNDLSRMSGKDFVAVLIDQTAQLLAKCVALTPKASARLIVKRVSARNNYVKFEDGHVVALWSRAPGAPVMFLDESNWQDPGPMSRRQTIPPTPHNGMTWHQMSGGSERRRWNNQRWARFAFYNNERLRQQQDPQKAKRARGVTAQTWLQIAEDLGAAGSDRFASVPDYVRQARRANDAEYKNGTAKQFLESAAAFIEISNADPILTAGRVNGAWILQRAIDMRLKAYTYEVKNKVFEDIAFRAKRYPGIFTA